MASEPLIAAAAFRLVNVAVGLAEHGAITVVHRRRVNPAEWFHLAGPSAGLASGMFFAKATSALMFWLAVLVAVWMTLALRLALSLAVWFAGLLCCSVRSSSTAAAPPSTSLPSGIAGRRIRSLIHISLLITFVLPRVADSHISEPHLLTV